MSDGRRKRIGVLICILIVLSLILCGCSVQQNVCYYGYFEDQAFAFVYSPSVNNLYVIRLPLEQILLWGKESGLESIPTAMRNYVGLKDSGFMIGTSATFSTFRDLLEALGSDEDGPSSAEKRVGTMVSKASVLSKKPLSDKISQLCGADFVEFIRLVAEKSPSSCSYDACGFFDSDDLNFSQRYFTQWLEQVLGGEK